MRMAEGTSGRIDHPPHSLRGWRRALCSLQALARRPPRRFYPRLDHPTLGHETHQFGREDISRTRRIWKRQHCAERVARGKKALCPRGAKGASKIGECGVQIPAECATICSNASAQRGGHYASEVDGTHESEFEASEGVEKRQLWCGGAGETLMRR